MYTNKHQLQEQQSFLTLSNKNNYKTSINTQLIDRSSEATTQSQIQALYNIDQNSLKDSWGVYVEINLCNLKGMNRLLGHTTTNTIIKEVVDIIKSKMQESVGKHSCCVNGSKISFIIQKDGLQNSKNTHNTWLLSNVVKALNSAKSSITTYSYQKVAKLLTAYNEQLKDIPNMIDITNQNLNGLQMLFSVQSIDQAKEM